MTRAFAVCFATWLAFGASSSRAAAQTDADARTLAVQLFDEAEELFSDGKVAAACPKYAESYRLDPQLGVLVYLAECYEKNGQLASAWASYREAEELGARKSDARGVAAGERARALQGRLNYLVILVPKSARVPGLEILRDRGTVAEVSWGARIPVDAGTRHIVARAPGYQSWEKDVVITMSRRESTLAVPTLTPLPSGSKPAPATATGSEAGLETRDASATSSGSTDEPGGAARPEDGLSSRDVGALVIGGVGLGALGVSGYLTYAAVDSFNRSGGLCNDNGNCTFEGVEYRNRAMTNATVATVLTSVGAAALVTAGILWFTDWGSGDASTDTATARSSGASTGWSVTGATSSWGLELHRAF